MPMNLTGKVGVVTGAGSGVGRATAIAMAECGVSVALIGRTEATLRETAASIESIGGRAQIVVADIGDEIAVQAAIAGILEAFGGIDILICAAGVGLYGKIEDYSLSDWNETISTNLTGAFLLCREVVPSMREGGGGSIIAVGSGAGKQGYANLAAYSASKFGLIGLMESLAAEVGQDRIKVSTVLPGSILTEFASRRLEEKRKQRDEGRKYLEPEDVAGAILNLLSQSERAWTQELNLWPF